MARVSSQARVRGYELLEPIGAGAISVIYRAREPGNGRIVAIKHLTVDQPEHHKYLRHMQNEYKVLRRLRRRADGASPDGIVTAYRLIRPRVPRRLKQWDLVMQYVEGMDLRKERRYPPGQIVDIMIQVADALSRLHTQGFIHGDLKPENIVVSPQGRATLVDFGFSCRAGEKAASIRGTRDYMAPEQVNMGHLTEKTDIYNYGATLYFLLTGQFVPALLPAVNDSSIFIHDARNGPAPARELNPNVPVMLDDMILRCVRKEPVERPSCIEEVKAALLDVRDQLLG